MTLGNSKDTSEFCCECIKDWWMNHGRDNYPSADSILALADGGGSNSSRHYIFKEDLQKLVDEIGIEIRMAHYPPYTSKYNPIEHRLFCHVTRACEGTVFSSMEVVKNLMDKTSTSKGLKVFTTIKDKVFMTARKASETFKEKIPIVFDNLLGSWNYRAIPSTLKSQVVFQTFLVFRRCAKSSASRATRAQSSKLPKCRNGVFVPSWVMIAKRSTAGVNISVLLKSFQISRIVFLHSSLAEETVNVRFT